MTVHYSFHALNDIEEAFGPIPAEVKLAFLQTRDFKVLQDWLMRPKTLGEALRKVFSSTG